MCLTRLQAAVFCCFFLCVRCIRSHSLIHCCFCCSSPHGSLQTFCDKHGLQSCSFPDSAVVIDAYYQTLPPMPKGLYKPRIVPLIYVVYHSWSHLWFAVVRDCPPWYSIVGARVTVHQFFCILHFCHTCSLCRVELVIQFPARGSTRVLLCFFPGVLWL